MLVVQVDLLLKASMAVDLSKLVISSGKAVWVAYLDMYVLDADGSVLDACMLAAVAAIASLRPLPSMAIDESGEVRRTLLSYPLCYTLSLPIHRGRST
jgi:exosome complex RNA-binding protein Rrp42 (RNase PH superfamily)